MVFSCPIGLQRCGKSCRLRWNNYLKPGIKRGKFSLQEDKTIIQLHALLGNKLRNINPFLLLPLFFFFFWNLRNVNFYYYFLNYNQWKRKKKTFIFVEFRRGDGLICRLVVLSLIFLKDNSHVKGLFGYCLFYWKLKIM